MWQYTPAEIVPTAAKDIALKVTQQTLALTEIGTKEIIHVFNPDKSWTSVFGAARVMETDVVSCLVDIKYNFLPEMAIYQKHENLGTVSNIKKIDIATPQTISQSSDSYDQFELGPHALRKFNSTGLTSFIAINPINTNKIFKIFKRGTPLEEISKVAFMLDTNIVLVRARAEYTVTGLAKIEKKYDELRKLR